MSLAHQEQELAVTEHALLIAYARFAEQIGLISAIEQVPFGMKTVRHSPAAKVIELLSHILRERPSPGARPCPRPRLGPAVLRLGVWRQPVAALPLARNR